MGIVSSLLGDANPFSQFVADNRSTIKGAFAGFGTGAGLSDGLSRSVKGAANGSVMDDARRVLDEEKAQQQQALNQTTEWLRNNGKDALYQAVSSGAMTPGDAWKVALDEDAQARSAASAGPDIIEVNGQLVNKATGQVVGDYRDPQSSTPSISGMPSSYQEYVLSTQDPGYRDFRVNAPAPSKPPTEAELRAAGLSTVIAPDAQILLGDGTPENPGLFDKLGSGGDQFLSTGVGGIAPLSPFASSDFRQAKDAVTSIAQSYLYSTSGASAPDAEVQRVADSVTPKPFDTPNQIAAKKERLRVMVESVQQKQGNAAPKSPAAGGYQVLSVE